MKNADEQRQADMDITIKDLKLRMTRLEHRVNNILAQLEALLEEE